MLLNNPSLCDVLLLIIGEETKMNCMNNYWWGYHISLHHIWPDWKKPQRVLRYNKRVAHIVYAVAIYSIFLVIICYS